MPQKSEEALAADNSLAARQNRICKRLPKRSVNHQQPSERC
jgi:hypothetical protein